MSLWLFIKLFYFSNKQIKCLSLVCLLFFVVSSQPPGGRGLGPKGDRGPKHFFSENRDFFTVFTKIAIFNVFWCIFVYFWRFFMFFSGVLLLSRFEMVFCRNRKLWFCVSLRLIRKSNYQKPEMTCSGSNQCCFSAGHGVHPGGDPGPVLQFWGGPRDQFFSFGGGTPGLIVLFEGGTPGKGTIFCKL